MNLNTCADHSITRKNSLTSTDISRLVKNSLRAQEITTDIKFKIRQHADRLYRKAVNYYNCAKEFKAAMKDKTFSDANKVNEQFMSNKVNEIFAFAGIQDILNNEALVVGFLQQRETYVSILERKLNEAIEFFLTKDNNKKNIFESQKLEYRVLACYLLNEGVFKLEEKNDTAKIRKGPFSGRKVRL